MLEFVKDPFLTLWSTINVRAAAAKYNSIIISLLLPCTAVRTYDHKKHPHPHCKRVLFDRVEWGLILVLGLSPPQPLGSPNIHHHHHYHLDNFWTKGKENDFISYIFWDHCDSLVGDRDILCKRRWCRLIDSKLVPSLMTWRQIYMINMIIC